MTASTSPTENTEELARKLTVLIIKLQDEWLRDNDTWYGSAETIPAIMRLIASSNHQAVQAFGEKVLEESVTVLPETFPTGDRRSIDAVPVSVITSYWKEK